MYNKVTQIDVSVIIPVYNVSQYLSRCIESVLRQDFKDFEVILVDDGSTDNSGEICDKYAYKHRNISVIHKKNGGLSSARLTGFKEARGNYICFIDSDDYLKDSFLSDLYKSIADNNTQMSICAYSYEKDGYQTDYLLPRHETLLTNIPEEFVLPILCDNYKSNIMLPNFMWLKMISRDIISEDLFVSERDVYQEDLVFNLLISNRLKSISLINKPNYVYCHNGESLTEKYRDNAWQMQINLYNIVKEFSERNSYDVDDALARRLINAVVFTVRNASKSDYNGFLQDIKHMKKDNMFIVASKDFNLCKSSVSQKTIFLCLRFKLYSLLYKILRK